MQNLTIIESPSDLEGYSLVERNLVDQHISFDFFLKKANKGYAEIIESSRLDYRPYQPYHAALFCVRRNNIMAHQQGIGKTTQSLLTIYSLLYPHKLIRRGAVHIAVPNILAAQRWVEELDRFPSLRDKYSVINKESELIDAKSIIIYTHDFPKRTSKIRKQTSRPYISRVLGKLRPSMLIVDEIHELNLGTLRTSHLAHVRRRSRRCLALSGTLSDNRLDSIYNLCSFVYGKHWRYSSKEAFTKTFGCKQKLGTNYLYGSVSPENGPEKYLQKIDTSMLPQYYSLMKSYIHRVKLDEPSIKPFIKIPEAAVDISVFEPTAEQFSVLSQFISDHKKALELISQAQSKNVQHRAQALKLIMPLIEAANYPGFVTPKLSKVVDLVNSSKKTVIFCNYVQSAWVVSQYLRQQIGSDAVVRLYAKDDNEEPKTLSPDQRIRVLHDFQFDEKVKVGVFSINLSNVSIDLTAADQIIVYCLTWSSKKLQQMLMRVVRSGNPNSKVKIVYLCHKGLIDEHQVSLAIEKLKGSSMLNDYEVETEIGEPEEDLDPMTAIRKLLSGV